MLLGNFSSMKTIFMSHILRDLWLSYQEIHQVNLCENLQVEKGSKQLNGKDGKDEITPKITHNKSLC